MARGKRAEVGDTRVAPNGYHYTKTEDGWRGTHELIIEERLGRPIDKATEMCRFKDGDRTNLDPDNLILIPKKAKTREARIAALEAKKAEIQAEIDSLKAEA